MKACGDYSLSDIEKTDIHTLVSVTVKVMMCEKPSTLGSKTEQNVVVSDHVLSKAQHVEI